MRRIREELAKIGTIVSGWENSGEVSDIEREIVLDKLRSLYEEVMFYERETAAGERAGSAVASDGETAPAETSGTEAVEPCPDVCMADAEPVGAAREPVASDPDVLVVKRTIDRSLILSLYDEGQPVCAVENKMDGSGQGEENETALPGPEEEPSVEEPAEALGGSVPEAVDEEETLSAEPEPVHEPESKPQPKPEPLFAGNGMTLGESLGDNGKIVGEAFTARSDDRNGTPFGMAANQPAGLRESLGLNDRFLLIRDLFGGDGEAYETAIDALDAFGDLDEALIHIHESYDWNPDCDGAKLLAELLIRKLG